MIIFQHKLQPPPLRLQRTALEVVDDMASLPSLGIFGKRASQVHDTSLYICIYIYIE